MAVMEVFCFLRFGGAFGTLGTAAIMAPSQRATAERSEGDVRCVCIGRIN